MLDVAVAERGGGDGDAAEGVAEQHDGAFDLGESCADDLLVLVGVGHAAQLAAGLVESAAFDIHDRHAALFKTGHHFVEAPGPVPGAVDEDDGCGSDSGGHDGSSSDRGWRYVGKRSVVYGSNWTPKLFNAIETIWYAPTVKTASISCCTE